MSAVDQDAGVELSCIYSNWQESFDYFLLCVLQVPHNQPVPQQAIDMLRTTKTAVLLMKCKPTA